MIDKPRWLREQPRKVKPVKMQASRRGLCRWCGRQAGQHKRGCRVSGSDY